MAHRLELRHIASRHGVEKGRSAWILTDYDANGIIVNQVFPNNASIQKCLDDLFGQGICAVGQRGSNFIDIHLQTGSKKVDRDEFLEMLHEHMNAAAAVKSEGA